MCADGELLFAGFSFFFFLSLGLAEEASAVKHAAAISRARIEHAYACESRAIKGRKFVLDAEAGPVCRHAI